MTWTTYSGNGVTDIYAQSTLLKDFFTLTTQATGRLAFTSDENGFTVYIQSQYGNYRQAGVSVSPFSDIYFTTRNSSNYCNPIDFSESLVNDTAIFAWRDNATPKYYLTCAMYEPEDGDKISIVAGNAINDTYYATMVSKELNKSISFDIVNANLASNVGSANFVLQPLCVFGTKTPFYTISGTNTELSPFDTFTVSSKQYLTIAKGLCTETV